MCLFLRVCSSRNRRCLTPSSILCRRALRASLEGSRGCLKWLSSRWGRTSAQPGSYLWRATSRYGAGLVGWLSLWWSSRSQRVRYMAAGFQGCQCRTDTRPGIPRWRACSPTRGHGPFSIPPPGRQGTGGAGWWSSGSPTRGHGSFPKWRAGHQDTSGYQSGSRSGC